MAKKNYQVIINYHDDTLSVEANNEEEAETKAMTLLNEFPETSSIRDVFITEVKA